MLMRRSAPSFPKGKPVWLRAVDDTGLQHWLGTAGDIGAVVKFAKQTRISAAAEHLLASQAKAGTIGGI